MTNVSFLLLIVASLIISGSNSRAHASQNATKSSSVVLKLVSEANKEREALISAVDQGKQYAPKSQIGIMLLCAKSADIGTEGWEDRLLKTLPKSDEQMEAFLEFTNAPQNAKLKPLFKSYYEKAFEAAGHHPEKLHAIFGIATQFGTTRWPDYDDSDWFCDEVGRLKNRIPREFQAALIKEKPSRRAYLAACGQHAPEPEPR